MSTSLRQKLDRGDCVVGVIVGLPSPAVVEYAAVSGYDFAVIDTEHGAISPETVEHMIRAGNSFGLDVIVRVGANDRAPIQVALDAGAAGIQVPMIETAEQAARAVRFAHYAPGGSRGLAGNRAAGYAPMNAELMRQANESVIVIAQIETLAGKNVAEAIAATPGVDIAFVGPTDLSQSLGVPGQLDSRALVAAIDEIAAAAGPHSQLGVLARDPESASVMVAKGFCLIEVAANSLIIGALRGYASSIHALVDVEPAEIV